MSSLPPVYPQSLESRRIQQAQELALQDDEKYRKAMAAAELLLQEDDDD